MTFNFSSFQQLLIGVGAGLLGLIITFGVPVNRRRINQAVPTLLIIVMFFTSSLSVLVFPEWLIAGITASVLALIYRDIVRFIKHVYWDVTKYSRRDYWYRRVGEAILGKKRSGKRQH